MGVGYHLSKSKGLGIFNYRLNLLLDIVYFFTGTTDFHRVTFSASTHNDSEKLLGFLDLQIPLYLPKPSWIFPC